MFDGSHYNLAVQNDKRIFDTNSMKDQFRELGQKLKESGNWIDPNLFALKCADCGKPLEGQHDAVEHAKQTGH